MFVRYGIFACSLLALFAAHASAQPGRGGALPPPPTVPPAPLYLPPPITSPQGLGSGTVTLTPRPLGYHVAPYGGLGYGPLGDRTGYPGTITNGYQGSYLTRPTVPPLRTTPDLFPLHPGLKMPGAALTFPAAPVVPRMPDPVPPGPVVPVTAPK